MNALTPTICADAVRYIDALSAYVWFLLALVVFLLLYPTLKGIIRTRPFTIKVAGMEIDVQKASDDLRRIVEDLQEQVSDLKLHLGPSLESTRLEAERPTVLWADDKPWNNAYEIAKLDSDKVQVIQARSTAEALATLESGRPTVDVVITDLGRVENGTFVSDAGLQLIRQAREMEFDKPIYVYTTRTARQQREHEVLDAGGDGITDSPVELLTMLKMRAR